MQRVSPDRTQRLFVSIPLQPEVKEALLNVQGYLPTSFFKPLGKENLHLTLAFLGDTPVEVLPALKEILDDIAGHTPPFSSELSGLGAFPNPWEPRVVWVGIDLGSAEAARVSDALRARLKQEKLSFDTKPFRPHITLAYSRKHLSRQELRKAGELFSKLLREVKGVRQSMRMEEISLVKSELRPEGAIHTPIHIARFAGG
jgi:2'-5' RNA ligase